MIVRGVIITPEQIAAAQARMTSGPFVLLNVARALINAGVPEENGVAYRAADRLIQAQREAGLIEYKLKEWAPCQPKPKADFLIQWCSYNPTTGGCCTHVTPVDSNKSLCGVMMTDSAGQLLSDTNGQIGCQRCTKALAKIGITPSK